MYHTTIDSDEVKKFSALAKEWENENGKFKILHTINPLRLKYIKERSCLHFNLDAQDFEPFKNLKVLDIGCGGGLLSCPMSKMGASVTAIDASAENIEAASLFHKDYGINFIHTSIEEFAANNNIQFDILLNFELIEHVSDPALLIKTCKTLLKPGGIMFLSTLNQTLKSFFLGIIAAEYILNWAPRGTHNYNKFMKPSNINKMLIENNLILKDMTGITYNPFTLLWRLNKEDISINYIMQIIN